MKDPRLPNLITDLKPKRFRDMDEFVRLAEKAKQAFIEEGRFADDKDFEHNRNKELTH